MSHRFSCPDPWEVRRTAQREARDQWWQTEPQKQRYDDCEESNRDYRKAFEYERDDMRQEERRREEHDEEAARERRQCERRA